MNIEQKILGNRYELIEEIGSGGMATVYKAKDLILKRFVAVKILREEYTTDNEFIKRFNVEAESAASLVHPNIVSVYDVGKEGNLYYIVMELVKGKTLKEIIVEDGRMGWKWSVKIAKQIASALEKAHKNNIIHRDIKPHNIIITEEGVAKVTDFGIAKAVSNSTITAFGTTIGSVHYFSPEHARGGYTDAKSDLYSLGVVLYEMVTGKVPFDSDTPVSVALKHMQETPVEPIKLNPVIPQSLNDLIMKVMQKDPNMRYANATEMIVDLDKILKNPEVGVQKNSIVDDKTQRIVINNSREEKGKKEKGLGKIKKYLEEHKIIKVALIALVFLIIFVATIAVTLLTLNSKSVKDVVMPDLSGLTLEEAETKAKESKLSVELLEEKFDENIPVGKIISQEPTYQENYTLKEGSTIGVKISKGQKKVIVTKLVGKTKDEVYKELKSLDLEMELAEENSDEVEAGVVIKQSIEEGEEVLAGSKIIVTVSLGIEQVEVPDLAGLSEDEAKTKIANAKLKWIRTDRITDASKGKGVVEQSISAKSWVDKGEEITIKVNDYEEIKQGVVTIDVASITGYTAKYEKVKETVKKTIVDEDGEEKEIEEEIEKEVLVPAEEVKLVVNVDDEPVESKTVTKDTKNLTVKFDGSGTVKITVWIDGIKKATEYLDFNSATTVTIK